MPFTMREVVNLAKTYNEFVERYRKNPSRNSECLVVAQGILQAAPAFFTPELSKELYRLTAPEETK